MYYFSGRGLKKSPVEAVKTMIKRSYLSFTFKLVELSLHVSFVNLWVSLLVFSVQLKKTKIHHVSYRSFTYIKYIKSHTVVSTQMYDVLISIQTFNVILFKCLSELVFLRQNNTHACIMLPVKFSC